MKNSIERRNFIKGLLTIGVITTTCPSKLLSIIEPTTIEKVNNNILGIYKLKISDFPILKELWGEIRLKVPMMDGGFRKVVITKIPNETYGTDFSAILELCTHQGYPIYPVNQETEIIECTGHGSTFDPTGKYISGPANKDLETYKIYWDGDDLLQFECYFYNGTDVKEHEKSFINEIYPNPASDYININFGTEEAKNIIIKIVDLNGNLIDIVNNSVLESGSYTINYNTRFLSSGKYFIIFESDILKKTLSFNVIH